MKVRCAHATHRQSVRSEESRIGVLIVLFTRGFTFFQIEACALMRRMILYVLFLFSSQSKEQGRHVSTRAGDIGTSASPEFWVWSLGASVGDKAGGIHGSSRED